MQIRRFATVLATVLWTAAVQAQPASDRAALVALYNATAGPNWTNSTNWLDPDRPLGEWHGVTTDETGRVTHLSLYENNLTGPIPTELDDLSRLTYLGLRRNQLSGAIPPELGDLSNLTYLFLDGNELSGAIPPELGDLSSLTRLYLVGNQLSGAIPSELGDLSSLTMLDLGFNQLSGAIPPELGNLSNLIELKLQSNELSGAIPRALGSLSGLTELQLTNNQLSGAIPPELGDLSNLIALHLQDNQLSGAIPPALGDLSYLTILNLHSNELAEAIPPELGDLGNLTALVLHGNQLSGAIPPELGDLGNLAALLLHGNQLSGAIPPSFSALAEVTSFYASGNAVCRPASLVAWHAGIAAKDGLPACASFVWLTALPSALLEANGETDVIVTANRTSEHTAAASLALGLAGTATSGTDYTAPATLPSLRLEADATTGTATFVLDPTDDDEDDDGETIVVGGSAVGLTVNSQLATLTLREGAGTARRVSRPPNAGTRLGDLDGDGTADMLLRHADGRWHYYRMDGRRIVEADSGSANLTRNLDWRLAGLGDLNGDGRDDVLLRHANGRWHYYRMDGRRQVRADSGSANLTRNLDWRLAGLGDLDGDGRDDVLLRHADGRWHYYRMDGRRQLKADSGRLNLPLAAAWELEGLGDLDGDGRDDVLLRHADGRWHYYRMDGRQIAEADSGIADLPRDLNWRLVALGDFDGNGHDGVLLRHADGRWRYAAMDGRLSTNDGTGPAGIDEDDNWHFAAVGDMNGDGRDDVLLRHADGRWRQAIMDGGTIVALREGHASLATAADWTLARAYRRPTLADVFDMAQRRAELRVEVFGEGSVDVLSGQELDCPSSTHCSMSPVVGSTVTLRAVASSGYEFDGWENCDAVAGTDCTVELGGNRRVSASFLSGPVVLKDNVVSFDRARIVRDLVGYDAESGAMTFAADADTSDIEVGTVLVSSVILDDRDYDTYFLRRVTSISRDAGSPVEVTTVHAIIEELIESGSISLRETLDSAQVVSYELPPELTPTGYSADRMSVRELGNGRRLFEMTGTVPPPVNGVDLLVSQSGSSCPVGKICLDVRLSEDVSVSGMIGLQIEPDFYLDAGLLGGLREFRGQVVVTPSVELEAEVHAAVLEYQEDIPLGFGINFAPIVVAPIVIVPSLEAKLELSANASAGVSSSVEVVVRATAGARYLRGQGWTPVWNAAPTYTAASSPESQPTSKQPW